MENEINREEPVYKEMYYTLFRGVTKALNNIRKQNYGLAEQVLCEAQVQAEQIFMETE